MKKIFLSILFCLSLSFSQPTGGGIKAINNVFSPLINILIDTTSTVSSPVFVSASPNITLRLPFARMKSMSWITGLSDSLLFYLKRTDSMIVTASGLLSVSRSNHTTTIAYDTLTRNLSFSTDNDRIRDSLTWVALAGTKLNYADTTGDWAPKGVYIFPSDTALSTAYTTARLAYKIPYSDTTTSLAMQWELDRKLWITDTTNKWAPKGTYIFPSDTTLARNYTTALLNAKLAIVDTPKVASGYGWNATQSGHTVTGSTDSSKTFNKLVPQVLGQTNYFTATDNYFTNNLSLGGATRDSMLTVNQGGHFLRGLKVDGVSSQFTGSIGRTSGVWNNDFLIYSYNDIIAPTGNSGIAIFGQEDMNGQTSKTITGVYG
ncbi:MAG: hypothetical protein WC974_09615, partial [Thermoplasmata archaeon]